MCGSGPWPNFLEAPERNLSEVLAKILPDAAVDGTSLPEMQPLDGLEDFLKELRNKGLPPVLLRDFEGRSGVI